MEFHSTTTNTNAADNRSSYLTKHILPMFSSSVSVLWMWRTFYVSVGLQSSTLLLSCFTWVCWHCQHLKYRRLLTLDVSTKWSRVSGVTTLRRPRGIEYCGCVCVCFMLILMFCSFACKIYEWMNEWMNEWIIYGHFIKNWSIMQPV